MTNDWVTALALVNIPTSATANRVLLVTTANSTPAYGQITAAMVTNATLTTTQLSATAGVLPTQLSASATALRCLLATTTLATGNQWGQITDGYIATTAAIAITKLASTGATSGQVITWNGTSIVWATPGSGSFLPLAGGSMTGTINMNSQRITGLPLPSDANTTDAATVQYVLNKSSGGVSLSSNNTWLGTNTWSNNLELCTTGTASVNIGNTTGNIAIRGFVTGTLSPLTSIGHSLSFRDAFTLPNEINIYKSDTIGNSAFNVWCGGKALNVLSLPLPSATSSFATGYFNCSMDMKGNKLIGLPSAQGTDSSEAINWNVLMTYWKQYNNGDANTATRQWYKYANNVTGWNNGYTHFGLVGFTGPSYNDAYQSADGSGMILDTIPRFYSSDISSTMCIWTNRSGTLVSLGSNGTLVVSDQNIKENIRNKS